MDNKPVRDLQIYKYFKFNESEYAEATRAEAIRMRDELNSVIKR